MLKFVKHVYEGVIGVEIYPIITLIIFFAVMLAVFGYAYLIVPKNHISYMKNVPLDLEPEISETSKA
ncbi:MAG: CcoQ/FixQ family Cbb3-type cytochrome c oxidase assembly chaperone [Bacteroidia bacterium]|nr:CcoQ/FixQ family Cbb3-type cytochrome c oxidase assembly chaperone [Bacteroidia bacterium]